jgi:hypothetical protein
MLAHPNPKRVPGAAKEVELWFLSVFLGQKVGVQKNGTPSIHWSDFVRGFPTQFASQRVHFSFGDFLATFGEFTGDEFSDFRNGSIWEDRQNIPETLRNHQDGLTLGFCVGMSLGKSQETIGLLWFVDVYLFLIQLDD